ncbi:MAG: PDZ domain-containing protein [Oscillospiraceae bacterium]|nr:PDZ domain-containing protein [Oscillospiraceae bacterium]
MGNLFRRFFRRLWRIIVGFFNIGISLKVVVLLLVLSCGGVYFVTHTKMIRQVGGKDDYDEAMRYVEIKNLLDEEFIDPVDRKAMGDSAAAAMVAGLGDAWSYYMTADEFRTYQLSSSNDYADIGISLVKDDSGGFQVIAVYPGSPASWAGVGAGMVITAVDGQSLDGMTVDEVRTLIRTKLNSKFTLTISNTQNIEVDCSNANASAVTYRMEKTGAGYLQITNFEAGSGQACVDAIENLMAQGAVAFVLDLRNNPGGLSTEVATLLDYLLPGGRLFSEVSKSGEEIVTESDVMCIQFPTVVLVNTGTFREAELCAAVLQEYQWATVMGEATTGNTRSQETIILSDGSAIRLSTHSYLTPNGVDISANGGVVPDTIVFNRDESATGTTQGTTGGEDGTASISDDDQLMAALRFLS